VRPTHRSPTPRSALRRTLPAPCLRSPGRRRTMER